MAVIVLRCTECNSWNTVIVHGYFSFIYCQDCEVCFGEKTMNLLKGLWNSLYINGKREWVYFPIEEMKKIDSLEDYKRVFYQLYNNKANERD